MAESPKSQICGRCGAALDGFAPDGLCPACLMDSAFLGREETSGTPFKSGPLLAFKDYELLEEIARGGMGVVYRARQISLDRVVAVKMILVGQLANATEMKRFRAEAETAAQLQHPNIVAIHEVGEHAGQPFFSMDFVQGPDLAQLVRNEPLPARKAAAYLKTIAEAVQYAHSHGVLHRDLKPSNILMDESGHPHVTDFGLAKRLEGDDSLTLTGLVLGSPSFIPPEQAAGQKEAIGPASDVYSLGAILYHCLTARPPFVAETMTHTLRMVAEQEPVSPRLLNAGVPRDLETICLKCLEKDPQRRYATAQELADDLGRFLRNEPIQARPVGRLLRVHRWCLRNKPLAIAGTAALALLLVVAIGSPIAAIRINRERQRAEANAKAEESERKRAEQLAEDNRVNLYAARIKLAEQMFNDGDVTRALQYLDSLVPGPGKSDLRGFDWYYLQQLCHSERLSLKHEKPVLSTSVSPDGSLVATAGQDAVVHLWDTTNGLEQAALKGHTGSVAAVVFAPDGKTLASAGADAIIRLWDVAARKQVKQLQFGTNSIVALAFSPDGRQLVAGEGKVPDNKGNPAHRFSPFGSSARIGVWNANTFELSRIIDATNAGGVRALAFSPDGRTLASGFLNKGVNLIETTTGRLIASYTNFPGLVFGAAFSSDGSELAVASWFPYNESGEIQVLDGGTLEEKQILVANAGRVICMASSPDRKTIATAGPDYTAHLWDFTTGEQLKAFYGHTAPILGLAFAPNGEYLSTAGWDGVVKLWDLNHDPVRQTIPTAQSYSVAFSPDGTLLACAGVEVELREASSGKLLAVLPGYHDYDIKIAFTPDGRTLVAAGIQGTAALFDVATRQLRHSFKANEDKIWGVAVSPDGRSFLTVGSGDDPRLRTWDVETYAPLKTFMGQSNSANGAVFTQDGLNLISGSGKGMKLWDIRSEKLIRTVPETGRIFAISPDGKTLAQTAGENQIELRNPVTWEEKVLLAGHKDQIYELAFSHDGRLLASASWDGTVKLWQVSSGHELLTIPSKSGVCWCVAFSPDDRTLAFGTGSTALGKGEVTILRAAKTVGLSTK